jgi:hypothetical protein
MHDASSLFKTSKKCTESPKCNILGTAGADAPVSPPSRPDSTGTREAARTSPLASKLAVLLRALFPHFLQTAKTDAKVEAPTLTQVAVLGLPIDILGHSFGVI